MLIAGVDEAGRGPLAGPVVAAVAVFADGFCNPEIRDSKQLSFEKREYLFDVVKKSAIQWAIVAVGHRRIDKLNIREATRLAMSLAVKKISADLVLIDGNMSINTKIPQCTVVGGDRFCVEISAASILAKVWRDRLMISIDQHYPGYGFAKHFGYPTKEHRQTISELGPTRIHRFTFGCLKQYVVSDIYGHNRRALGGVIS